jgi:hypothetical protein
MVLHGKAAKQLTRARGSQVSLGVGHPSFPLTPALSPRERERGTLTPALSPREREKQSQRSEKSTVQ